MENPIRCSIWTWEANSEFWWLSDANAPPFFRKWVPSDYCLGRYVPLHPVIATRSAIKPTNRERNRSNPYCVHELLFWWISRWIFLVQVELNWQSWRESRSEHWSEIGLIFFPFYLFCFGGKSWMLSLLTTCGCFSLDGQPKPHIRLSC